MVAPLIHAYPNLIKFNEFCVHLYLNWTKIYQLLKFENSTKEHDSPSILFPTSFYLPFWFSIPAMAMTSNNVMYINTHLLYLAGAFVPFISLWMLFVQMDKFFVPNV